MNQQREQERASANAPIGATSPVERSITMIPIVIGRNRLRGNGQGAMVEDIDGENLATLRAILRDEAKLADVEPTPEWLTTTISQLLRMYDEHRKSWRAEKNDTVGFVFEAAMPSGKTVIFSEAPTLARFGKSIEETARNAQAHTH